jgi:hypothetical protein
MALFPNVPFAPGVPPLPRLPGAIGAVVNLILSDALSLLAGLGEPQWGLFLDGIPVISAESVVSFEFKQGAQVANFPIEGGKFEAYDKVQRPFDIRLRFATGDTLSARQDLLDSAKEAVESLDLMDAVSPEAIYENVNPTHFDYRRTAQNGVGLIVVDIFCEQIRTTASSTFTSSNTNSSLAPTSGLTTNDTTTEISVRPAAAIVSPQSPGASPQINVGTVQPQAIFNQATIGKVLSQSLLPF